MLEHIAFLITGIILWTLLEYVIHRFLGHKKRKGIVRKEHLRHHAEAHYFAPMYKKFALAVLVLTATALLVGWLSNMQNGLLFSLGFAGMYFIYEVTHRRFHIREPLIRYGLRMRKHHFYHHFGNPKFNHGVTTAFWDRIFATFRPVKDIQVPQKMAMTWLTDDNRSIKKRYQRHFKLY